MVIFAGNKGDGTQNAYLSPILSTGLGDRILPVNLESSGHDSGLCQSLWKA